MLHNFEFILLKDGKEIYSEKKKTGLRIVKIIRENDGDGEHLKTMSSTQNVTKWEL